jgi:transposase
MSSRPERSSLLDPFRDYLLARWSAGCTNSAQLWRELRAKGFGGSASIVRDWAQQQRSPSPSVTKAKSETSRPLSARRAAWLLIRPKAVLAEEEQHLLDKLLIASPRIAEAYGLAQRFGTMVRLRTPEAYESWQQDVQASNLVDLQRFATSLRSDQSAVINALQLEWSNGPTEGAITRLTLIKSAGYGRMKFDLLRKRVLAAA